jgi:hypothetical protein
MLRVALGVVVFGTLFLGAALPQNGLFAPVSDVSFKILTDKKNFRVGDQITVKYSITNTSGRALYVPLEAMAGCPAPYAFVWASLGNRSGESFSNGYGASCLGETPLSGRISKEALLLKPGERRFGTAELELDKKFFSMKPGLLILKVTLSGWTEKRFTSAELAELARLGHPFLKGEVSESMHVTVTK